MKDVSDVLTVSFDSGVHEEAALCVSRKVRDTIVMLKMELGEQADILHHLLTEQMAKAEVRKGVEPQGEWILTSQGERCNHCWEEMRSIKSYPYCPNCGCRMVEPQERSGEE